MKYTLLTILLWATFIVHAQSNQNLGKSKLAVKGYDVVSYFSGEPSEGKKSLQSVYQGGLYYFSNVENKNKFDADPEKYLPQYGGWCAYAMGVDGSKVKIDPETFTILDDKLYLFYNFGWTNTLTSWKENETDLKLSADKYWMDLTN